MHALVCLFAALSCCRADVEDSAYEIKWTSKDPKDDSHKAALRHLSKEVGKVKDALKTFTKEIYEKGQKPPEVS